MADVGRAHGGDCGGGDPPDGRDIRRLSSGCEASGSSSDGPKGRRGKTRQLGLDKIMEARKHSTLDIAFEEGKLKTYKPVGNNKGHFTSLVGSIVDRLPMNLHSWDQVPQSFKDALLIELQEYFNMAPWLDGPIEKQFRHGFDRYCRDRYKDHKFRFKERYFDAFGGEDDVGIRARLPPGVDDKTWNEHVDFYLAPEMKKRVKANKANKAKQKIKGHGGRHSFAHIRHINRDPDSNDPLSPIESYRLLYTDTNGNFVQDETRDRYAEMVALRNAQMGVEEPLSDEDIMRQVLGPRPGWDRGIGPKLRAYQPPIQTQGSQRFFSQSQVEEMINNRLAESQQQHQKQQTQWRNDMMEQMRKEMRAYMKGNAAASQQEDEATSQQEDEESNEEEEEGEDRD